MPISKTTLPCSKNCVSGSEHPGYSHASAKARRRHRSQVKPASTTLHISTGQAVGAPQVSRGANNPAGSCELRLPPQVKGSAISYENTALIQMALGARSGCCCGCPEATSPPLIGHATARPVAAENPTKRRLPALCYGSCLAEQLCAGDIDRRVDRRPHSSGHTSIGIERIQNRTSPPFYADIHPELVARCRDEGMRSRPGT